MEIKDFCFKSSDNLHDIYVAAYLPNGKPRAVLQIIHGVAEHKGRYSPLATELTERGFAVYICDLLGHGLSAEKNELGFFAENDGWELVCKDVVKLFELIKDEHTSPVFIMGHSMGSFIARTLHIKNEISPSGFIFMGTGYISPAVAALGRALSRAVLLFGKDKREVSTLVNTVAFGSYATSVKGRKTDKDWISSLDAEVDRYVSDPLCGFAVSTGLFLDMLSGIKLINDPKNLVGINKSLPLLLIAGEDDPVGDMGKGVKRVASMLKEAGAENITVRLFSGNRHELLNDKDRAGAIEELCRFMSAGI